LTAQLSMHRAWQLLLHIGKWLVPRTTDKPTTPTNRPTLKGSLWQLSPCSTAFSAQACSSAASLASTPICGCTKVKAGTLLQLLQALSSRTVCMPSAISRHSIRCTQRQMMPTHLAERDGQANRQAELVDSVQLRLMYKIQRGSMNWCPPGRVLWGAQPTGRTCRWCPAPRAAAPPAPAA